MNSNLTEILVANGTGSALVIMLFLSRINFCKIQRTAHGKLFDAMLFITLLANIAEAISFLIDGKDFVFCHTLQLLVNFICVGATVFVGYFWCLYTDFRIHRSQSYVKRSVVRLGIPLVVVELMLFADLFGARLLIEITPENVYARGKYCLIVYLLLFVYYGYSIVTTFRNWKKTPHAQFFPVQYFILPCIVGTIIQGMFYGITIGWMTVAVAFVFVQLNLYRENAYIDTLSELYNRNYFSHIMHTVQRKHYDNVFGIMLDVNNFKKINDTFGHVVGDDAIRAIGSLLKESVPVGSVALRMGGDEFVVMLTGSSRAETDEVMQKIQAHVTALNEKGEKPYTLSISIGSACFDGSDTNAFLSDMDKEMYECKARYYHS